MPLDPSLQNKFRGLGKLTLEQIRDQISPIVPAERCVEVARVFDQVAANMGLPEEEIVGGAVFVVLHNLLSIKERG